MFTVRFVYVLNLGFAVFSMWPNKQLDLDTDEDDDSPISPTNDKQWEMQPQVPMTPRTPFTPRTQALHTLDRKLPLRSQYG